MTCRLVALPVPGRSYCYWNFDSVCFVTNGELTQTCPLDSESQCLAIDPSACAILAATRTLLVLFFSNMGQFDDLTPQWSMGVDLEVFAACFGEGSALDPSTKMRSLPIASSTCVLVSEPAASKVGSSAGGRWVACATAETIQVYDVLSGVLVSALSQGSRSRVLRVFSATAGAGLASFLLAVAEDSTIVIWEAQTWTRVAFSAGRVSFARALAADFRQCGDQIAVATIALVDGRVAALSLDLSMVAETPSALAYTAISSIAALLLEAGGDADCAIEEGECVVSVEVLHESRLGYSRLPMPRRMQALIAVVTQRRFLVAGLTSCGKELHGLASAGLEALLGRPFLARDSCLSPSAANLCPIPGSVPVAAALVIGAVLGGRPVCADVEHVLQAARKAAHAFDTDAGCVAKDEEFTPPAPFSSGIPTADRVSDVINTSGIVAAATESSDAGEGAPGDGTDDEECVVDDATVESVAARVPNADSFLVQVSTISAGLFFKQGSSSTMPASFSAGATARHFQFGWRMQLECGRGCSIVS